MAGKIAHPSKNPLLGATACMVLALIFAVIAPIIPAWSRVIGTDGITAIQNEGWLRYTDGKPTTKDSTLYIGQWEWCLEYGDDTKAYTCSKVLLGDDSPPSYRSMKCKGYLYGSRILSILAAAFTLIALIVTGLAFSKVNSWNAYSWTRPTGPAAGAVCLNFFAFALLCVSWIMWIVVAEHPCRPTGVTWNPFQGYSTSFIIAVFATGFALIGFLLALVGMASLGKVPHVPLGSIPDAPKQAQTMSIVEAGPGVPYVESSVVTYPVTAPAY